MPPIDSAALAHLFDRHAPGLVLYARQWLTAALAEDVVQDVFLRLAAAAQAPENPRAWLLTCTRNAAFDAMKTARRRQARDAAAGKERAALVAPGPEDAVASADVHAALAGLAAEDREILTLRLWAEATFAEIAALTGLSISTVHQRYGAALRQLKMNWESPCRSA
jgi:RNA polymerase sigma-70 factor (ECF subfamily)